MSDALFALLRDYLKQVETYFKAGIATEHTYRPALQQLLTACIGGITVTNEPKRVACGAPDYVISRLIGSNALTIGYVEAKDIGVSLDKVEHGEQMERYLRALDNLVLTDYLKFRRYVKGEKQMTARLAAPHSGKSLVLYKAGAQQVANLLDSFLNHSPEPVVSYIVRSVDYLLREQFDLPDGLADTATITRTTTDENGKTQSEQSPRVLILDPACGTGTFSYAIVDLIRETYRQTGNAGMWSSYVRKHLLPRLFGFELLMAPYAVAHLKLGMQLAALDLPKEERTAWAYDFASDERLGIFLTNTLEQALVRSRLLLGGFISDEANEAAKVKQELPIMVVLGNPPYSGHSANKGEWITDLLRGDGRAGKKVGNYFEVDGKPLGERNPKWLNDDYVKFLRFAQWRIEQTGYGILAFITNHGYLDNPTFRGMRQSLMQTFDDIYVLDLHSNSKKKERSPDGSKDENVFDIQQGVAIGIFVKRQRKSDTADTAIVHHAHLWGPREIYEKVGSEQRLVGGKYYWLAENDITKTEWTTLVPTSPFYLFRPQNIDLRTEYELYRKLPETMLTNVPGFQTHRDHFAVDFDEDNLNLRIGEMRDKYTGDQEYTEKYRILNNRDWQLNNARQIIRSDALWKMKFIKCLYRPFDKRYCYFSEAVMDYPRKELLDHVAYRENLCILSSRQQATPGYRHCWVSKEVSNDCVISTTSREANQVFPLYLYPNPNRKGLFDANEPSTTPGGRRPNLSPAFITDISGKLAMQFVADGKGDLQQTFGPEDMFHYMYAVFHAPMYRTRYAEFLKIDFPRLPLTTHAELFRALCNLGERLVGLHLMEKFGTIIIKYPVNGNNVVEKIEYLEPRDYPEQGRVSINKTQYFEGVPSEVWNFHVGGYQVCHKWLKDRKGRMLTFDDLKHYQRIVAALAETITLMEQIDEAIEEHGGWPLA
ncbi:MAG: type ISP restriction/modification enzyme [Ktedonobacteraceae bacterium]